MLSILAFHEPLLLHPLQAKLPSATQVLPGGVVDILWTLVSDTKKKLDNPSSYLFICVRLWYLFSIRIITIMITFIHAAALNVFLVMVHIVRELWDWDEWELVNQKFSWPGQCQNRPYLGSPALKLLMCTLLVLTSRQYSGGHDS